MNPLIWVELRVPFTEGAVAERRIVLPVSVLSAEHGQSLKQQTARGLLDTGASASGVSTALVGKLGLVVYARKPLFVATEQRIVNYFAFQLGLFSASKESEGVRLPYVFEPIAGFEINATETFDVIIGMDILSQTDFELGRDGSWSLHFG